MTVLLDEDGLDGAGGGGAQHVLTLRLVRGWIVPERFLPMQLEDAGGEKTTLGIGLAPIEINHHMDGTRRCGRFCHVCMRSCHLFFLPVLVRSLLQGGVHCAPARATPWCSFACGWSPLQRAFPHSKVRPAGLRVTTQEAPLSL